jgi:hypothetical protein
MITAQLSNASANSVNCMKGKEYNISSEAVVAIGSMSLTVPNGWKVKCRNKEDFDREYGSNGHFFVSGLLLELTTTKASGDVYLSLNEAEPQKNTSLEATFERFKNEGKNPIWKTWSGMKWVETSHSDKSLMMWSATSIVGARRYVLVASAPSKDLDKYRSPIQGMMKSVKIRQASDH